MTDNVIRLPEQSAQSAQKTLDMNIKLRPIASNEIVPEIDFTVRCDHGQICTAEFFTEVESLFKKYFSEHLQTAEGATPLDASVILKRHSKDKLSPRLDFVIINFYGDEGDGREHMATFTEELSVIFEKHFGVKTI